MNKRLLLLIGFGFCLLAHANPVPPIVITNAYIASEKLTISIFPTEAQIVGTFMFRISGDLPKWKKKPPVVPGLAVPVWFPETNDENASVGELWQALKYGGSWRPFYILTTNVTASYPGLREACTRGIGFRAYVGGHPYSPSSFMVTPPELDTPGREYLGLSWWRDVQEPGFQILRFGVPFSLRVVTGAEPVVISYRQPLLKENGTRRFFYAPILLNMPSEVVSSDTNLYAIALKASADCELAVEYGDERFYVGAGHTSTLAPKHFQAIRVSVKSVSKPGTELGQRAPLGSEKLSDSVDVRRWRFAPLAHDSVAERH